MERSLGFVAQCGNYFPLSSSRVSGFNVQTHRKQKKWHVNCHARLSTKGDRLVRLAPLQKRPPLCALAHLSFSASPEVEDAFLLAPRRAFFKTKVCTSTTYQIHNFQTQILDK